MSTRGAWGFRVGGADKLVYNHFDSGPDHLGEAVAAFASEATGDVERCRARAVALLPVHPGQPASLAALARLRFCGVPVVADGGAPDWYDVLREIHGSPEDLLALGVYEDAAGFVGDSLFCEYAYVVNLDRCELEVYRGLNRDPGAPGRYAHLVSAGGYRGVALVEAYPIDAIPPDWAEPLLSPDEDDALTPF